MRVRAKVLPNQKYSGYYNHRRRLPGEVFELVGGKRTVNGKEISFAPETTFSPAWMEKIDKDVQVATKPIEQPAPETVGDDVI